jgi:hypothetical protein
LGGGQWGDIKLTICTSISSDDELGVVQEQTRDEAKGRFLKTVCG